MSKILLMLLIILSFNACAEYSGAINVGGDIDKFYPVTWTDGGWDNNVASELEIGRSYVHLDANIRGSMIAKFRYHTYMWGNRSNFIDADLYQAANPFDLTDPGFIAGWADATSQNSNFEIVIWLKGGNTTYYYRSPYPVTPHVYDGVQNALPFMESGGPARTFKTAVEAYVNPAGLSKSGSAYFSGGFTNYFLSNVGIGALDTKGYKLAVAGNMIAESIKVKPHAVWPDDVFEKEYNRPFLLTPSVRKIK